ncbi:MAG: ABC transporter permease subunit [Clostridia bacterium]|nr:ABC transporter permease subunit [Clostridia bacterium]
MNHATKKLHIPEWVKKTCGTLIWVLLWTLISLLIHKELLVPTPAQTIKALGVLVIDPAFWQAAALSMLRILCGFGLAAIAGTLGGILSDRCKPFHWLFDPLLHLIRSVPVASFIILALVWIHTPWLPVFIAFLMVLPLFWGNIRTGMANTDSKELEMGKVLGLSRLRLWKEIRLPALAPYFRTACVTGLGFAWKSGVAAEVICRPDHSLGDLLQGAKVHLETPTVFALTVVIALLSLGLELLLNLIWKEKKV